MTMQILNDILHQLTFGDFWQLVLENGALLLLPALGGIISERSGVVNIAMEGMMLAGAFVAVVADLWLHNPWLAALAAMLAGGAMAAIHAVLSIRFRADQIISGIAINIFAAGFTGFLVFQIFRDAGGAPPIANGTPPPLIHVPLPGGRPLHLFRAVLLPHQFP